MNDKFDELAKALAQPIARRKALKQFGVGAAVALLAVFGLATRAEAGNRKYGQPCSSTSQCKKGLVCAPEYLMPNPRLVCQYPHR